MKLFGFFELLVTIVLNVAKSELDVETCPERRRFSDREQKDYYGLLEEEFRARLAAKINSQLLM